MPNFYCSVAITTAINDDINAADRYEAACAFKAAHGCYPDEVGEDAVVGACEACERALFEGDDFSIDEDGIQVCLACLPTEELARLNAARSGNDEEWEDEE